ncbi:MAG: hypothetical protein HY843_02950 [Bdellovibrio sp.]|nr:hypothetical protein [Bdellovibrio sp.]
MYQLKRVETQKDWEDFIDLPWMIYLDYPHWVPPLRVAIKDMLNVRKNPFFKHAVMFPLLAYRGDECVGRIMGIIDDNHNNFHKEKTAFFGFFECIDDQALANLFLDEIAKWAATKGMNLLRGPMNLSTNHECGLLIEGFEDSPTVNNVYNPPYYAKLIEQWGFKKAKDLYAYIIDGRSPSFSNLLLAQAEKLKKSSSVTFRTIDMKNFDKEVEMIHEIYNQAWEENWGFVPLSKEEFKHMAKDMKAIIDPELLLVAEVKGNPVGFTLTIPDVNQILKKIKNGKLFPLGFFKLLWNLKGPGKRSAMNRCRILTLGIKKEFRPLGIGPLLYAELLKRGPALGYPVGEASWILEDNEPMNRALVHMGAQKTKVYRLYDKAINTTV